jgi:predicted DNA-binding protein with PD1-like motif
MGEIRYKAAQGQLGRVIAARLLPGTDLVEGMEKICEDYEVRYAFVNCSIGSLQKATFMIIAPKPEAKIKAGYTAPFELPGPIEFLGGHGIVCKGENGESITHFHGVISDQFNHVYGGHFVKGKNPILATMDLIIIEVKDVKLLRRYDEETDLVHFAPEPE